MQKNTEGEFLTSLHIKTITKNNGIDLKLPRICMQQIGTLSLVVLPPHTLNPIHSLMYTKLTLMVWPMP